MITSYLITYSSIAVENKQHTPTDGFRHRKTKSLIFDFLDASLKGLFSDKITTYKFTISVQWYRSGN